MFRNTESGYAIPMPGTVEGMEVKPASRGGGYILHLKVGDRIDTMVFSNSTTLTQTLLAMLNGEALLKMREQVPVDVAFMNRPADNAAGAPASDPAPAAAPKKKGGRPKMTDEQKAAAKAAREARRHADVPVEAGKKAA